jgi:prepilin-type N-terminal cleavage/methylation domain-containing protein
MTPPRQKSAFTLIELVSVLAIIVVLLSIVLGSYAGWTRATGIDAATGVTVRILSHAREQAITQGIEGHLLVRCQNLSIPGRPPCGLLAVYTCGVGSNDVPVLAMPTNALPVGVSFRLDTERVLEFLPDGTCRPIGTCDTAADGSLRLILDSASADASRRLTRVVDVDRTSGRIRVQREDVP